MAAIEPSARVVPTIAIRLMIHPDRLAGLVVSRYEILMSIQIAISKKNT
jgi:hypothetical protein